MPSVLIIENVVNGHRGYYAGILTRELLELGANVTLAAQENILETAEGTEHFEDIYNSVEHFKIPLLSGKQKRRAKLKYLKQLTANRHFDHVFIPYVDGLIQQMGLVFSPGKIVPGDTAIEGLMMRGAFAYPADDWKRKLQQSVSRKLITRTRWTQLHHLDPLVATHLNNASRSSKFGQVRVLPEAIQTNSCDRDEAKKQLGLAVDRVVITSPGAITERKGIHLLARSVKRLKNKQVQLVLIGKTSPHIQKVLQVELADELVNKKVIWENRYATAEEFDLLFSAADLVCIPYVKHIGSSSILIRAAKMGCPVLTANWGWLEWAVKNFDLGWSCDVTQQEEFDQVLAQSLEETSAKITQPSQKKQDFLKFHKLENHLAHWTDRYCQTYGVTPRHEKFELTFTV